jgi:AraC family transcriptional regulator
MSTEEEALPDVISTMGRWWNRQPSGVAQGSNRTDVCAALWCNSEGQQLEVFAEGNPDYHIACLQMVPSDIEFYVDDKLRYDGKYIPGNFTFINAGGTPRALFRGQLACMHIYIPPSLLCDIADAEWGGSAANDLSFIDTVGATSPALMRVGQELLTEMRGDASLSRLRTDALGLETAVQMLRHHSNLGRDAKSMRGDIRGGLAPWQVRRVKEVMMADLAADQSLGALAAQVGLSPFHFARAFKKSVGIPPHAYQVRLRLEHAEALLLGTARSVTEIAMIVGYESSQALARAFHRTRGCTPSDFRRMRC